MATFVGKVVDSREGARLVLDESEKLLFVTKTIMQAAGDPMDNLVDLATYLHKRITLEGQTADDNFVWGAEENSIQAI